MNEDSDVKITSNVLCRNCFEFYAYRPWKDTIAACPSCTLTEANR